MTRHHPIDISEIIKDDEADWRLMVEVVRRWNKMSKSSREYLAPLIDMAAANNFGPIDEDVAI